MRRCLLPRGLVPGRAFGRRRRQRQPRPELDFAQLDVRSGAREGLPINQASVDKNLLDRNLPQAIRIHEVAAGGRRALIHGDVAHVSVQPTPARPAGAEYSLDRMDDAGVIHQVQA
jgi:hypothetical protein